MQESTNNRYIESASELETCRLAGEIFNKTLVSNFQNKQQTDNLSRSKNYQLSFTSYRQVLKNLPKIKLTNEKKKKLFKSYNFKKFYLAYSLLLQIQLINFKLKSKQLTNKSYLTNRKNFFYSNYMRLMYFKMLQLKSFMEFFNEKLKTTKTTMLLAWKKLHSNLSATRKLKNSSKLLKIIKQISNLETVAPILNKKFLKNLSKFSKKIIKDPNLVWKQFSEFFKKLVYGLTSVVYNFRSLITDKQKLSAYFNRLTLVFSIYLLPFIFLATQALVPLNEEYQYLIVNPFSSRLFNKIPFLIDLIKIFQPLTTNSRFLIWVPLAYYLTFTSGYRSLKIPYKIAFNGTIASIFLIINYSCVLIQFLMRLVFESINIIKDIFFTSFLIKHLNKNKNRERDEAVKIFANLVSRYNSEMTKNYYQFLLFVNHRIFSHLALISLAALLYNCIYYVIHNKNPEIILVTKTALATIKNPQEEE